MTRNQKHRLQGNAIPAGYGNAYMLLYASGVNCNLNSNYTKYLAQLCDRVVYVLENFHRKFAKLVAPPSDVTTKPLVSCKSHLVL